MRHGDYYLLRVWLLPQRLRLGELPLALQELLLLLLLLKQKLTSLWVGGQKGSDMEVN